jgi:hypothetical protein
MSTAEPFENGRDAWWVAHNCDGIAWFVVTFPGYQSTDAHLTDGGHNQVCDASPSGLRCTFSVFPGVQFAFGLLGDLNFNLIDSDWTYSFFLTSATDYQNKVYQQTGDSLTPTIEVPVPRELMTEEEWRTDLETWLDTLKVTAHSDLCGGQFFSSTIDSRSVIGFVADCPTHDVDLVMYINAEAFGSEDTDVVVGSNHSESDCGLSLDPDHQGMYACHVRVLGGTSTNNHAFGIMLNAQYDGRFEQSFTWVEA